MEDLREDEVIVEEMDNSTETDFENSTIADDDTRAIENIIERLENENISAFERSDEERLDMIDNADISDLPTEVNQSENGVYLEEDPYLTEPLNTPEQINEPGVPARETIYEDCPRPEITEGVNMDDYTNEEQYGNPSYGDPVSSGISGKINDEVETIGEPDEEKEYAGEDADIEEEDEEMARNIALEEEEEKIEIPEELVEDKDEEVEEAEDTEGEEEEIEVEEVNVDEDTDEVPEDEEVVEDVVTDVDTATDVETSDAIEGGEEGAEVVETEIYAGVVNDDLSGELRKEVEAIELVDNANTKMLDGISFLKDKEFGMTEGSSMDKADESTDLIHDGVGLQETYDGEPIVETGASEGEAEVGTDGFIPGADEAKVDEELEEQAATESLRSVDTGRSYSLKNVLRNFWGQK